MANYAHEAEAVGARASDPLLAMPGLRLAGMTHPLLAQHADVIYAPCKSAQYAEACDWMHLSFASDAGGE